MSDTVTEDEMLELPEVDSRVGECGLSPRHRRFAQLYALQTVPLKELSKQTGYSYENCRILSKDPNILKEVYRLQDRIFDESIKEGLKSVQQECMNYIRFVMSDNTGRVNVAEKAAMTKWVIEKLDGKSAQKHDIGENTLALFMDQLAALNTAPPEQRQLVDVTPKDDSAPRTESEILLDWIEADERSSVNK